MEEPIVKLVDVGKGYSVAGIEIQVLREVNLQVHPGEFVNILGSYGSGRTTLLNIIGLICRSTSGRVFVFGKDVTGISQRSLDSLRTKKIGFFSRAFGLVPEMTVQENLELAFHLAGVDEIDDRVSGALSDVGLEGGENRLAKTLSPLESKLLSIARNMAADVSLLVCDDPAAGLSKDDAGEIARLLIRTNEDRGTSIVAGVPSHRDEFDIGTTIRVENGRVVG
jgi:putative ABC transport system ATP-binding protein